MESVRDRLWIFTCVAGSDNDSLTSAGYTQGSRMTPAEGALFLDVPNLHMIRWRGLPAYPYDQFAVTFSSLKQVTWSIVGSGGQVEGDELQRVLDLAGNHPNVTGVYLDDFMRKNGRGALSVDDPRRHSTATERCRQTAGPLGRPLHQATRPSRRPVPRTLRRRQSLDLEF